MDKKYYKNNYYKHFFRRNYGLNYAFHYNFIRAGIPEIPFTAVVESIRKLTFDAPQHKYMKAEVLSPKKMCNHIKHWQASNRKRALKNETNSSRRMYNKLLVKQVTYTEEDTFERAYYGKNHEFGDKWKYW